MAQYGVADEGILGVSEKNGKGIGGAFKGDGNETQLAKTMDGGQGEEKMDADGLIEDETADTGSVRRSVYFHYLKSLGWDIGVLTIAFHILAHGLTAYSNIWLSKWSSEPASFNRTEDTAKRDLYLGVYGGLGLGQGIPIFVKKYVIDL